MAIAEPRPRGAASARRTGTTVGGCESGYIAPQAGRPRRRLRRLLRRLHQPLRPPHRPGPQRHRLARQPDGPRRRRHEVPLPVDVPDRGLAARPERRLRGRATCCSSPPTRARAGRRSAPTSRATTRASSGPRAGRSRRTTPASSTTARSSRSRSRRCRRACSGPARDDGLVHVSRDGGQDLDERHAEGPARVEHGQPDRSLAARRGHGVPGREPLQARRLPALRLRDARLRPDLDEDHGRHAPGRVRARGARGPRAQGPALRRHRDGRVRLVRRRRALAAAGHGPARRDRRRGGRDRRPPAGRARSPTWSSRATTWWSPRRAARSGSSTTSRPLRQGAAARAETRLFTPSPAVRFFAAGRPQPGLRPNPPNGAIVYYSLTRAPKEDEEVTLEFLDASGAVVRKLSSKPKPDPAAGGGRRRRRRPAAPRRRSCRRRPA